VRVYEDDPLIGTPLIENVPEVTEPENTSPAASGVEIVHVADVEKNGSGLETVTAYPGGNE